MVMKLRSSPFPEICAVVMKLRPSFLPRGCALVMKLRVLLFQNLGQLYLAVTQQMLRYKFHLSYPFSDHLTCELSHFFYKFYWEKLVRLKNAPWLTSHFPEGKWKGKGKGRGGRGRGGRGRGNGVRKSCGKNIRLK